MSLISIVIPCYNCQQFIEDAINSCLDQTYKNIEIVLVDDHSKDDTFTILSKYAYKYPSVIRLFRNDKKGANAARNFGIKASCGDYIQLLDSDDILLPDKLQSNLLIAQASKEHPVAVFSLKATIYGHEKGSVSYTDTPVQGSLDFKDLIFGKFIQTSCTFFPKYLFTNFGLLDEDLPKAQEHELNVRFASYGVKYVCSNEYGVIIRNHNSTERISNSFNFSNKLFYCDLVSKFILYLDRYKSSNLITKEDLRYCQYQIIKLLIFGTQLFSNQADFQTVKSYSKFFEEIKVRLNIKYVFYKSPHYSFLLNTIGLYNFESFRYNIMKLRKLIK